MSADLLAFRDFTVEYPSAGGGWREVLSGLTMVISTGEHVALVGESGSGKSVAALAALGLVAPPGRVSRGRVRVAGLDLAEADTEQLRRVRGREIGLVFQEPSGAFNPVLAIGPQIVETVLAHRSVSRREASRIARDLLARTALEAADGVFGAYPHQLSGGQVQRAMIALALAGEPGLLIADEPTTALDLRTQARILELLRSLADEGRALMLISHDLAVVEGLVDRVVVLFAGEVVEAAPSKSLFGDPLHPYTRQLLEAARPDGRARRAGADRPARAASSGCRFADRCDLVEPECRRAHPALEPAGSSRFVRCPVALRKLAIATPDRGSNSG